MPKLEPYSRKLDYSYQLGVFPSLMLLEARPDCAVRLLLHSQGLENEGVVKLRERCAALGVREELADRVLRRESRKDNCFAGLVFRKYESDLSPSANHAVLCQITDNGNAGTAMRVTKAGYDRGFMPASDFFSEAVESTKDQAQNELMRNVNEAIVRKARKLGL